MTPEEAKAAGSAAWQTGNFEEAVRLFGEAIDNSSPADKDFLKILYSNRSAAYLKLGQYSPALLDGNKCVELDCNWAKGYLRKGDALYQLKKYTDCFNAYNYALRISPGDVSVKEKCEIAQKAIRGEAQGSQTRSPAPTPATGRWTSIQTYIRIFLVVNAFLYFLPFFGRGFSAACYRNFVFSSLADFGLALFIAHGVPKFNMQYAQTLLLDPTTMYFFMSGLLLASRPYLLAMAPILLTEAAHVAQYTYTMLAAKMPTQLDRLSVVIDKYLPPAMQKSPEEWTRLSSAAKWQLFNSKVLGMAAYCEVMQGLYLIIELVMPTRSFLFTMMWWQFLQMRYLMDQTGNIKATFRTLDGRISTLLAHRLCPAAIRSGYGMMKVFLAKQVTPPQPGQERPGLSNMMSKCTIM